MGGGGGGGGRVCACMNLSYHEEANVGIVLLVSLTLTCLKSPASSLGQEEARNIRPVQCRKVTWLLALAMASMSVLAPLMES